MNSNKGFYDWISPLYRTRYIRDGKFVEKEQIVGKSKRKNMSVNKASHIWNVYLKDLFGSE